MNFNENDFMEALNPNQWHLQETGLTTPTFTARIIPGQGLLLSRRTYGIKEAEELTRFLSNNIDTNGVEATGPIADQTRFIPGVGLVLAATTYSVEGAKALTRALVDQVGVKPLATPDTDLSWFQPKRLEE